MKRTNKSSFYFAADHRYSGEYEVYSLTVCEENDTGYRHAAWGDLGWSDDPLRDLTLSWQRNRVEGDREPYGLELTYCGVSHMNLGRMKKYVKFLNSVERKMAKMREDLGPPGSVYDSVRRYAKAIGIVGWIIGREDWSNGTPPRSLDLLKDWMD